MAQAMRCDMCGQENAQVMQQNLENGDILMIGPSCQIIFHLTVAAEMLTMLPEANLAAYAEVLGPVVDKLAAADPRAGEDIKGPAAYDGEYPDVSGAGVPPAAELAAGGVPRAPDASGGSDGGQVATIPPGGAQSDVYAIATGQAAPDA